jgi:hypothetical protein
MESNFNFPTEIIELPSKGLLYPPDSPLASGKVEMKYMTAREEDILTNRNYIEQGIVIDKLLQSMVVTKFNYDDLLIGDKDLLMLSARILGYGKDYTFSYYSYANSSTEKVTVDLTQLKEKSLVVDNLVSPGRNEFSFKLPNTNNKITFKLLTNKDEQNIDKEIKGLKKINPKDNFELVTRLRHMIISVNGDSSPETINNFINNGLLARDAKAFREYVATISPGIDLKYTYQFESGVEEDINVPITLNFFWPDA